VPFSSFLSTTQLQFLPALHAASLFKERHAAHFSGGVGFLPCAIAWWVNATIAAMPTVHRWLGFLFTTQLLTSWFHRYSRFRLMHPTLALARTEPSHQQ